MKNMHIVSWSYSDGSAYGMVAVLKEKEDAEKLLEIMEEHGDQGKKYRLDDVEVLKVGDRIG